MTKNIVITISSTAIPSNRSVLSVADIVNALPESIEPGTNVELKCADSLYVNIHGLALLATWRQNLPQDVTVKLNDSGIEKVGQYILTFTGFRRIIDIGHDLSAGHPNRRDQGCLYPLTNNPYFRANYRDNYDQAAAKIARMFETRSDYLRNTNPYTTIINALCKNVSNHSESNSPGYVCAFVKQNSNVVEIAIADTGIGIEKSYLKGTNENAKKRINAGASALEIAIDGKNPSNPDIPSGEDKAHKGHGFHIVRRLVDKNQGIITLISGDDILTKDCRGIPLSQWKLDKPWKGTFVGITLYIDRPLLLAEILEESEQEASPQTPQPVKATSIGKKSALVASKHVVDTQPASVVIEINDTGIAKKQKDDTSGVEDIVNKLCAIEPLAPGTNVELLFSKQHKRLMGLVLVAAWRRKLPSNVNVKLRDDSISPSILTFINSIGFTDIIDSGHEHPSVPHTHKSILPLYPITDRYHVDNAVREIIRIFNDFSEDVSKDSAIKLDRDNDEPFDAIKAIITELFQNVLTHSKFDSPGYVSAKVQNVLTHDSPGYVSAKFKEGTRPRVDIAIADTGIGIKKSYLQGTNTDAKTRIEKGESALAIAIDGRMSSTPDKEKEPEGTWFMGSGLHIVNRLVKENRGMMTLISGNDILTITQHDKILGTLSKPWKGTFVGITLGLDEPLPISKIYEEIENWVVPSDISHPAKTLPTGKKSSHVALEQDSADIQPASDKLSESQDHDYEEKFIEFELCKYGTELLQDEGVAIRADLASHLLAMDNVRVSLDGVSDIAQSVVEDAFGKLADTIGIAKFEERVKFKRGKSVSVFNVIELVLKKRTRPPINKNP